MYDYILIGTIMAFAMNVSIDKFHGIPWKFSMEFIPLETTPTPKLITVQLFILRQCVGLAAGVLRVARTTLPA